MTSRGVLDESLGIVTMVSSSGGEDLSASMVSLGVHGIVQYVGKDLVLPPTSKSASCQDSD